MPTNTPPKERNSNIELYRIIMMVLIVAHHYVVCSSIRTMVEESPLSPNSMFLLLIGMWGKTAINGFVLITGYFMCKSSITVRKYLKLIMEVLFYKFLFFALFTIFPLSENAELLQLNLKNIVMALMPVTNITDGFVSCFLFFYLTIPFLNILIQNMTQRQHAVLVALSLLIYTVWGMIFDVRFNYITWFIVLYFVASYIRFYGLGKKNNDAKFWGRTTVGLMLVAMISVVVLKMIGQGVGGCYRLVSDSNAILALTIGVTSFMWFKNLTIKQNRLINTIAASAFGVLLIHSNSAIMRHFLWNELLQNATFFLSPYLWLHAFLSVVIVYTVCTFIDYLRIRFLERPFLNSVSFANVETEIQKMISKVYPHENEK